MFPLCKTDEISEPGSKGFAHTPCGAVFVIRRNKNIYVYANSCPHRQTSLEWQPDQFLDDSQRMILCSHHGALFRAEDGLCLSGPCAGESLRPVPFTIINGLIALVTQEPVSGSEQCPLG